MSEHKKRLHRIAGADGTDWGIVDRRRFLAGAGGAIGLTAASWGLAAAGAGKPGIEFIQSSCGQGKEAGARVLVAYASRAGSTGGVADAIAKELCALGAAADVRLIKQVTDLGSYQAVVIGSPAHSERWLPEAKSFVMDNKDALARVPVAYFITCLKCAPGQPSLSLRGPEPEDEPVEKKRLRVKAYLDPLLKKAPEVKPLDIAVFAGALDYSKLTPSAKAMLRSTGFVEGDFRNWERIKAWTKEIAPELIKQDA